MSKDPPVPLPVSPVTQHTSPLAFHHLLAISASSCCSSTLPHPTSPFHALLSAKLALYSAPGSPTRLRLRYPCFWTRCASCESHAATAADVECPIGFAGRAAELTRSMQAVWKLRATSPLGWAQWLVARPAVCRACCGQTRRDRASQSCKQNRQGRASAQCRRN